MLTVYGEGFKRNESLYNTHFIKIVVEVVDIQSEVVLSEKMV